MAPSCKVFKGCGRAPAHIADHAQRTRCRRARLPIRGRGRGQWCRAWWCRGSLRQGSHLASSHCRGALFEGVSDEEDGVGYGECVRCECRYEGPQVLCICRALAAKVLIFRIESVFDIRGAFAAWRRNPPRRDAWRRPVPSEALAAAGLF